jgi:hypothetical protein
MKGNFNSLDGMKLLSKLSCMSDEARWSVDNFTFEHPISDNDYNLIKHLRCVGDGELTGISAGIFINDLLKDVPERIRPDIVTAAMYIMIVGIEEYRHGVMLGQLCDKDFIEKYDLNQFGKENLVDLENTFDWDIYGILLSLCLSEAVNTELYRSVASKVECEHLKSIFINIMKDEARHLASWTQILSNLASADEYHRMGLLEALKSGSCTHVHNASVGSTYIEGMKDTFHAFNVNSINVIVESKFKCLTTIFGESPISQNELKRGHLNNLLKLMS